MRSRLSPLFLPTPNFSNVRMICEPTEWLGLSVSNGFWNTIWMDEIVLVSRFSIGTSSISVLASVTEPDVAVSSPRRTLASVDLPQPDSPTIATVSDSLASKLMDSLALTTRVSLPPKISFAAT